MKTNPNDPAKREYNVLEDNTGIIYTVKAKSERDACRKAMNIHSQSFRGESEFGVINESSTEN